MGPLLVLVLDQGFWFGADSSKGLLIVNVMKDEKKKKRKKEKEKGLSNFISFSSYEDSISVTIKCTLYVMFERPTCIIQYSFIVATII